LVVGFHEIGKIQRRGFVLFTSQSANNSTAPPTGQYSQEPRLALLSPLLNIVELRWCNLVCLVGWAILYTHLMGFSIEAEGAEVQAKEATT